MPVLRQLRDAGFSVWPFDSVRLPLILEIYPRALTGAVQKDSSVARDAYLRSRYPELPAEILASAAASDDAFDALVSALVMWEHRDTLVTLTGTASAEHMLEGRIWLPGGESSSASGPGSGADEVIPPAARAVISTPPLSQPDAQQPWASNPAVCPFCSRIAESNVGPTNDYAVSLQDGFPVSPGHTLVVSREHEADFLHLPVYARDAMWHLVNEVCEHLRRTHSPDGFNLGVNIGDAAGQTVPHAHIHVIPRHRGDVDDPRGGVRRVLPSKAKYW
jgi:diadenosine tetraphosphate (Ap4A) HIT family hydrolase